MRMKPTSLGFGVAGMALVALACGGPDAGMGGEAVQIDTDDIGGVVMGPNGPEAGVWVIAERPHPRFVRSPRRPGNRRRRFPPTGWVSPFER